MRVLAVLALLTVARHLPAQSAGADSAAQEPGGRVVLVLPFDNRSGEANLNWIGDSFPDTLDQRLNSAGFLTISHDDRAFALDHLGLPPNFRPTRATTLRIAQTLDANFVVVGNYTVREGRIMVQAQVLEVNKLRMSAPLDDSSELARLFDIENAVAWKVARQIDPKFSVAQQTFLAASAGVNLTAFENYIRGLDAPTPAERVKRLQAAVAASPSYAQALLALGKQEFADLNYAAAAADLDKVPPADRLALEAGFYKGLARFNDAKYADAEAAFAFVATRLPLPEVVNNQGVAASRQGKDASALLQRAANADPNDPDYHYNVAVATYRKGDFAAAQREIAAALKLRPNDAEAKELQTHIAAGRTPLAAKAPFEPLERIRRTYSEASFRQAAFQLDQMRAMRLATLPPAQQAAEYTQLGHDYLKQGLLPEAEQEFEAALAADKNSAAAYAGIAQIREQSGNAEDARLNAQNSLRLKPNVPACLVLARLNLVANDLPASAAYVGNALRLNPKDPGALGLKQQLESRGQSIP
ncbi:Tfp pilus assembly protein PilF [Granulicella rosea]|uniref:Tfp pilus assembly protein PilF n=1 Tax=Granulicella rosea TaxID=474952 RepID=A0A239L3C9_9BACT|nr:Tfp pilus assembly protein PilF [Granulicella rosea]